MSIKFFKSILLVLVSCYIGNAQCRELLQLNEVHGYNYGENNNEIIIPRFNLKEDTYGNLYHEDELLISRKGKFKYCLFQVFKDRFLVVSILTEKEFSNNYRYLMPKNKLVIYDLLNIENRFEVNVKNQFIHDIFYDEDVLIVNAINNIEKFRINSN